MIQTIQIAPPDDWHLHLRDGEALEHVVAATALNFRRAIVMPNLKPPVTTVDQAVAYKGRILAAIEKACASGDYTEQEQAFARQIQRATGVPELGMSTGVKPLEGQQPEGGSTDVADVSWVVPTLHLSIATSPLAAPCSAPAAMLSRRWRPATGWNARWWTVATSPIGKRRSGRTPR